MKDFYIVSIKHSQRHDPYITFWRPDNAGYAWPLSWAGKYDLDTVMRDLSYYNSGEDIAVPCGMADSLAVAPAPRTVDGDAGPVVLNTKENWKELLSSMIAPSTYEARPEVFGRRKLKQAA